MATLKGQSIAASYQDLVKRADTYSQTGTNVELMDDSGDVQATGLYLESNATTSNVGIGTDSPNHSLSVGAFTGTVTGDTSVLIGGSGDTHFIMGEDTSNYGKLSWDSSENSWEFSLVDGGSTRTNALVIDQTGNIGIGTAAPAHTLSVVGDAYLDGMTRFGRNASNTTISSGILTATHTVVRVVPESSTADDVDEITAGEDGDFLILSNASNTDTITYKHNNASTAANRLRLAGGADFAAVNRYDYIMLIYRSSGHAAWFEVSRSDNG